MTTSQGWHFDKRMSLDTILAVVVIAGSINFWSTRLETRVTKTETEIAELKERVTRGEARVENALTRIEAMLTEIDRKIAGKADK